MKLSGFQVTQYKGVADSSWIDVEDLTVLVGKNEAGKTTLLRALHKLNPATPQPYVVDREWPRGLRDVRDKERQVVCRARFTLTSEEAEELAQITLHEQPITTVEVTRDYGGNLEVVFSDGLVLDKIHPNEVDHHCEALPNVAEPVGAAFRAAALKVRDEARRLAGEGRYSELETLYKERLATLQGAMSPQDGQPQHQNEQNHIGELANAAHQLAQKLKGLPSLRKQAHEFVVTRLPKFIYMDDYRAFAGKAQLDQVKQRRDSKKLEPNDETFLMILALSGLNLDDLVAKGTKDREQRQYDIDDGGHTLTRRFSQRLKQREYEIQFRADGQEFFTMVKDTTVRGLIQLEERSKGFQWFFSFDLLFMHESQGTFENCVVLLDEPGLHLHPGAQKDLLARLEAYAQGNTLVYSTHLPFMIDLTRPERIRVINETEKGAVVTYDLSQTQPEAKLTLQAALGMSGSQSYLVAQRNVVVEGVDDYMILNELSELLWRSGVEGLPEDVHITACGGASEVAYIATFMIGQQLGVVVLLDSDTAGTVAADKLVKSWLTRYKGKPTEVLSLGEIVGAPGKEFAVEDLFPDDFYVARVKEVYARELAAAGGAEKLVLVGQDQLSKRVERALEALGIKLNKGSVAKRIRRDLSRMKSVDELPAPTREYATKLVAALTKALA